MDNQALADGLLNFGRSAYRSAMQPINGPMDFIGQAGKKFGWLEDDAVPGSSQWVKDSAGPTHLDGMSGKLGGIIGAAIPMLLAGKNPNLMGGLLGLGLMMAKDKFLK